MRSKYGKLIKSKLEDTIVCKIGEDQAGLQQEDPV